MSLKQGASYYKDLFTNPLSTIKGIFSGTYNPGGSSTPATPATPATPNFQSTSQLSSGPTNGQTSERKPVSPAVSYLNPESSPYSSFNSSAGQGNNYSVKSGDTLSAIASKNNMSLKDLISLNPQYQANPNLIRVGEAVKLGGGTSNVNTPATPTLYSDDPTPTGPVTPPEINPATGGYYNPPTPNTPAPAPVAPDETAFNEASSAYEKNLQLTPEEIANQEKMNALDDSVRQGIAGEGERAIPLEFITGRQKSIETRGLNLEAPLSAKAALLQAKRLGALDASKFRLGIEADKLAAEKEAKKPISGSSFYDPVTGTFKTATADGTAEPFTLGKDQARYDSAGNLIASNLGGGTDGQFSNDAKSWIDAINGGKADLSDVPQDFRTEVIKAMGEIGGLSKGSTDAISQAGVVMDYIDRISPMINGLTTGITGMATSKIPGTDSYDLAKLIDTVKANVGFSALQAMRNASPTGGALGQVSEMENRLLQATLGSLDQGQSPEQINKNLAEIKLHFNKLIDVLNQEAQGTGGGGGGGESTDETTIGSDTFKLINGVWQVS